MVVVQRRDERWEEGIGLVWEKVFAFTKRQSFSTILV
jgi:hypothetical protein